MSPSNASERGPESEHENMRVPAERGKPPRPATEPAGAERSTRRAPTDVDPGSGEPLRKDPGQG